MKMLLLLAICGLLNCATQEMFVNDMKELDNLGFQRQDVIKVDTLRNYGSSILKVKLKKRN